MHQESISVLRCVLQDQKSSQDYALTRREMHDRDCSLRTDFHKRLAKIQDLAAELGLIVQRIRRAAQCQPVENLVDFQWTISNQQPRKDTTDFRPVVL
jgi:hypothetical protein